MSEKLITSSDDIAEVYKMLTGQTIKKDSNDKTIAIESTNDVIDLTVNETNEKEIIDEDDDEIVEDDEILDLTNEPNANDNEDIEEEIVDLTNESNKSHNPRLRKFKHKSGQRPAHASQINGFKKNKFKDNKNDCSEEREWDKKHPIKDMSKPRENMRDKFKRVKVKCRRCKEVCITTMNFVTESGFVCNDCCCGPGSSHDDDGDE